MSLVEAQHKHAHRLAMLILYAESLGYMVTGGDWYRDERCKYGYPKSKHRSRLATDLNLFSIDDESPLYPRYLQATEDHLPLGEYWEKIGGVWGGRFSKPDGNHYESPA